MCRRTPDDDQFFQHDLGGGKLGGPAWYHEAGGSGRGTMVQLLWPAGNDSRVSAFYLALATNDYCPAGFFSNKVVFVGGAVKTHFSGERKDEYRTPYTKNQFIPGDGDSSHSIFKPAAP